MLNNTNLQYAIHTSLAKVVGQLRDLTDIRPLSGGCINSSFTFRAENSRYFIKINNAKRLRMFEAELLALNEIRQTRTIRAPVPVCTGCNNTHSWIIMEHLSLSRTGNDTLFGEQLASMHAQKQAYFGWHTNNTIGTTSQINTKNDAWPAFYRQQRLEHQLNLAQANGCSALLYDTGMQLASCLDEFFTDYSPRPSLLHGDLWGGNYSFVENGEPVIYDPASYYGDREADIAMTELFGGFSQQFRSSYEAAFPLDQGYAVRRNLYNCYHVLNHFNLFGGGYMLQAEELIKSLLSERNT